jgi:hypothetical protein
MYGQRLITRAELPNINDRSKVIDLSNSEVHLTSSSESILRQTKIPANTFKRNQHLNIKAGGFGIANGGGVVNSLFFRGRFGNAGLSSSAWFSSATYNPGTTVVFWFLDAILTRDTSSPDYIGIGGIFFIQPIGGGTSSFEVLRGELNDVDFTINNDLIISTAINGTGSPNVLVSETYEVIKQSLLIN